MDSDIIERFMLDISESAEYKKIEYLMHSIRKHYLDYMSNLRSQKYAIPSYLIPLAGYVQIKFEESGINPMELLQYMIYHDESNWVKYYRDAVLRAETTDGIVYQCEDNFFIHLIIGFLLDYFRSKQIDIQEIVKDECLLYDTNQYGLSVVENVVFKRDSFIYDGKAYLYNMLTNMDVINFGDEMPGFARIISEEVHTGNLLLRLDERLALPENQMITYSTLNFEKFRGPQFHFGNSRFDQPKTIIERIDPESADKLLMVIKNDYDSVRDEAFMHIEIETLPYFGTSQISHCITTFLHGMYYPKEDCFTHIDYARNQYEGEIYMKKYEESSSEITVDHYAEKQLHYKIWCIENGRYSRDVWLKLMMVSLPQKYRRLLEEILE